MISAKMGIRLQKVPWAEDVPVARICRCHNSTFDLGLRKVPNGTFGEAEQLVLPNLVDIEFRFVDLNYWTPLAVRDR